MHEWETCLVPTLLQAPFPAQPFPAQPEVLPQLAWQSERLALLPKWRVLVRVERRVQPSNLTSLVG